MAIHLSLLLTLGYFLFLYRLADRSLNSSHEARAAQHAQMMISDGAWLLPRLYNARVDLQKPPLYYWLVAWTGLCRGGEVDAFAVRLPAALAAFCCVLAVYLLLAVRGRPGAGLGAALVLATCVHFTWLARVGRIDMPLTLASTLALGCFHAVLNGSLTGKVKTLGLSCGYIVIALGVLLKGPIALVLVGLVVALVLLVEGRGSANRPLTKDLLFSLLWGVPLTLLIAAPWFVYANWQTEGKLWQEFFVHHNLQRGLGGADDLAGEAPWYYLPRLGVDLLPWSLFVPVAAYRFVGRERDADARFGLLWFLAIVGFLSLMHFKRADYLLPAYPGFALWLGCVLFPSPAAGRSMAMGARSASEGRVDAFLAGASGCHCLCVAILTAAGWIVFLNQAANAGGEDRRFADEIRRRSDRPVIFFRTEAHEVVFHVGRPMDTILEWENLDFWACRPKTTYMVMPPECAACWRTHLKSGKLEEVLRLERRDRPLVLMRSVPNVCNCLATAASTEENDGMKPIRLLLADDHHLVRAGIHSWLMKMPEVEVVGEATNGREALALTAAHRPDVVLMDIMMPELNGLDATARIVSGFPNTRVIILSVNANEEWVLQALRSGAAGYLLKDIDPAELQQAVRAVAKGETYLSTTVSKQVVAGLLKHAGDLTTSLSRLTPRQREVLQLIAEGNTTKQIAKKLGVSAKTAEAHRTQLMDAVDIHDIASLTRYAIRMGLVAPE